jgi:hypothetical protein
LTDLVSILSEVHQLMQPLNRSSIKESGSTFGMGATRKFHKGRKRAFESYLLKAGKFRAENGDTLEEARPQLARRIAAWAQKLEQIIFHIYPQAAVNRYSPALKSTN